MRLHEQLQPGTSLGRPWAGRCAIACLLMLSLTAQAHVKWFAPYIVQAPPQQLDRTLTNPWFWTGIGLVLLFFMATRAVETTALGHRMLAVIDKLSGPLWARLDDFVRFVIAAFFVAIFAVGGVYLTPDLKTPHEWVSWMQLLIAGLVFSRRTQPLAAAGILLLWMLALTEYQFFHLLDYLALGVGVAAYLLLDASSREDWRKYRFVALRWGVAIALMWSSLEKFAYPEWFYPLVEEKPFLTFGMPRDVFIPMAGVAEFTMGFGLLWTALVRRLSAITLFIIFNAAVYPFGRVDLVGHALIMAVIVAIAADPTPQVRFAVRRPVWSIPAVLLAFLVVFSGSYWGLHRALYGTDGGQAAAPVQAPTGGHAHGSQSTAPAASNGSRHFGHTVDAPPVAGAAHGAGGSPASGATAAYEASMARMHGDMLAGVRHPDPDVAFVRGMLAHHQAVVDMARIELQYGKDDANRKLAAEIIATQQREIDQMQAWLKQRGAP
jgi:hypothetical protein